MRESTPCPLGRLSYPLNQAATAFALTLGPSADPSGFPPAAEGLPGFCGGCFEDAKSSEAECTEVACRSLPEVHEPASHAQLTSHHIW